LLLLFILDDLNTGALLSVANLTYRFR